MKRNILFVGILALLVVFATTLASATINVPASITLNATQNFLNTTTFTVYNNDSETINLTTTITHENFSGSKLKILPATLVVANNTTSSAITISLNTSEIGVYTENITISTNQSETKIIPLTINISAPSTSTTTLNFSKVCSAGLKATTNLSITEIEDKSDVDDDWNWKALDDIKVRVTLTNEKDKDNTDYTVRLYFFDESGVDKTSKFVDDTDVLKQNIENLDNSDSEDIDFTFKLSTDVDDGSYTLVVKAYKKGAESTECNAVAASSKLNIEQYDDDYAIVSDVLSSVSSASCGDTIDMTATVVNLGSNDQDRVRVLLYNKDLGLKQYKEIDNLDSGDSTDVVFSFAISSNAVAKLYRLTFSTEFNYDDNDDDYNDQSNSEDDYIYSLNVVGNCNDPTKPTVTATLNSTAKVDEDATVLVTIKNNANSPTNFILSLDGYSSWAELKSIEPNTFTLAKQETKQVLVKLTPTVAGQQTFTIKTIYNGQVYNQPVTITIAENKNLFDKMTDKFGKTATYLIIGIVALIVLIVIIFLIRAFTKRD